MADASLLGYFIHSGGAPALQLPGILSAAERQILGASRRQGLHLWFELRVGLEFQAREVSAALRDSIVGHAPDLFTPVLNLRTPMALSMLGDVSTLAELSLMLALAVDAAPALDGPSKLLAAGLIDELHVRHGTLTRDQCDRWCDLAAQTQRSSVRVAALNLASLNSLQWAVSRPVDMVHGVVAGVEQDLDTFVAAANHDATS